MSTFGWDLPPGVRVSDIPGNRPEDQAAEAFYENMYAQFPEGMGEHWKSAIAGWAWEQMGKAYDAGYHQGRMDGDQAAIFNAGG
jgi:hypothetical protein